MRIGILGSGLMGAKLGTIFAPSWHTASCDLRHNRGHVRACEVGQLLHHRGVGRRCADRLAVRRANADCQKTTGRCGRCRRRIRQPDDRPFRCCAVFVGHAARTVADDHHRCSTLGLLGIAGVAYTLIVSRRMRKQVAYRPVFEDWLFHVGLPLAAYATLAGTWFEASERLRESLFGVGGAGLLLLFIGIHNAWDGVSYHVLVINPNSKDVKLDETKSERIQEGARHE